LSIIDGWDRCGMVRKSLHLSPSWFIAAQGEEESELHDTLLPLAHGPHGMALLVIISSYSIPITLVF
jgi:hypothetical protein